MDKSYPYLQSAAPVLISVHSGVGVDGWGRETGDVNHVTDLIALLHDNEFK